MKIYLRSTHRGFFAAKGFAVALAAAGTFLATSSSAAVQQLHGEVPSAVARQASFARVPSTNRLNLAIGLPLRNRAELEQLAKDIYDPASANYQHYLTLEEFTARFGPTEQDYEAVKEFARTNGFNITHAWSNRVILDVEVPVAQVENAFHIKMNRYHHPTENRDFYAPDSEPTLNLDVPIAHVNGLNDYVLPRPAYTSGTGCCGSGPSSTYVGTDFRRAYAAAGTNVTYLTGAGQNIGLFQYANFYSIDITNYETQFGLSTNFNVVTVPVNGGITNFPSNAEVALDIEMAMAMAPGAAGIYVFEGRGVPPIDLLNAMAQATYCKQLSCSWAWGGATDPISSHTNEEALFIQMQIQGQSFFAASGDSDGQALAYPGTSPNITSVGGTVLNMTNLTNSAKMWSSEKVWNSSGTNGKPGGSSGGISATYAIPYYQQGINMTNNGGSFTNRNVPDVAMVAQDIWITYNNGGSGGVSGTSAAAPLWAGYMALVNQLRASIGRPSAGFINPAIYAIGKGTGRDTYTNCFHDITVGDNTSTNSLTNFVAVAGYDLCTGWGTPSYPMLAALADAEKVYWVDLTVSHAADPIPDGQLNSPFWYLVDSFPQDAPGALGRVPSGAQVIFLHSGTESSSTVSGTGVSRISQNVRISASSGANVRITQ